MNRTVVMLANEHDPCRSPNMADDPPSLDPIEPYRDYLLMLARVQIGPKYRAKIDPEEIVNQTLFEAHRKREQFWGLEHSERAACLKRMLSDNVKDAIKFLHRDKRDLDREQRLPIADWDQSCSRLFDITCGLTSPSGKAIQHERELQLANARRSVAPRPTGSH